MSDLYSSMFLIFEFALFVLQKSLPLLFLWWFLFDPMICRPHVFEVNVWAVFELLLDAILPFLCCSFFGGFRVFNFPRIVCGSFATVLLVFRGMIWLLYFTLFALDTAFAYDFLKCSWLFTWFYFFLSGCLWFVL